MIAVVAAYEFVLPGVAGLLEVLPHELHRGLHRLRASAEGLHIFEVSRGDGSNLFNEVQSDIGDPVQGWREGQFRHLSLEGGDQSWVTVPERCHKNPADGVEVPFALRVPIVKALCPVED